MDFNAIANNIGFDVKIFIFNIINFIILALLLKKFLFGKIENVMNERQRLINQGLEDSRLAEERLKNVNIEAQEVINNAHAEKDSIIGEAHTSAKRMSDNLTEKAKAEAESIILNSKLNAEKQEKNILMGIKLKVATLITSEIKEQLIKQS